MKNCYTWANAWEKADHEQRGQGLVELALVIPVLLIIVIGLLDLGRAFFAVIVINNSAREGARYLILHPDDKGSGYAGTIAAALLEADGTIVELASGNIAITLCRDLADEGECESGFPVRVRVTYTFEPIMGLVLPESMPLSRSAEMLVP
jgi:Flp pilus assembly protein TadG